MRFDRGEVRAPAQLHTRARGPTNRETQMGGWVVKERGRLHGAFAWWLRGDSGGYMMAAWWLHSSYITATWWSHCG